jgi:hypothetical protein
MEIAADGRVLMTGAHQLARKNETTGIAARLLNLPEPPLYKPPWVKVHWIAGTHR